MTTDVATPGVRPRQSAGRGLRGLARRFAAGPTLPVALILAGLLVVWYVAAIFLNAGVVLMVLGDKPRPDLPGMIVAAWSQERPLLPAPHQILFELQKTVLDVAVTSKRSLVFHAGITAETAFLGFVIGAVLGVVLAVLIVLVKSLRKALMPWIIASQTVPILAVAPIVIVVLGNAGFTGTLPKALISAYLCFFPVTIGMVKGLASPEPILLDLMRTYHASTAQTFFKLRWMAAVPYLFASLKVAVAISLVGAIVAELPTGAQAGLGARLLAGSYYGQTVQIWAALFVAAALAALAVLAVQLVEAVALRLMGARR